MKYNVKITQVLTGFVEIEADSPAAALETANTVYNKQGRELPEMEDGDPLSFTIEGMLEKEIPAVKVEGPLTHDEVEKYLRHNGYPHPGQSWLDEFLNAGDRQCFYDEAVRNNYELCDVDRWFHLQQLLGNDISFAAAMFLDYVLWEEQYEIMEINSVDELCSTPERMLEKRLRELVLERVEGFSNVDASIIEWNLHLTEKDFLFLVSKFEDLLPEDLLPEDLRKKVRELASPVKPALSAQIAAADSRAGKVDSVQKGPSQGVGPRT